VVAIQEHPRPTAEIDSAAAPRIIEAMVGRIVSPEIVGRDVELEVLANAFADASAGRARVVLVGGEAGIGKTRLVGEATERARADGALVLSGGCVGVAEGSLPFGPIVEAIRPLVRTLDDDETGDPSVGRSSGTRDALRAAAADLRLVGSSPIRSMDAAELRPEWARSRLYETLFDLLRRLGEERVVMLVVEDVHWADDSTRELLAFLVRNVRDERLLIVATFRSDELHRRHPLLPWLAEVDRVACVERIELARLDRDEVMRQLAAILGGDLDGAIADAIWSRSEGNPFFAEELLATGARNRRLPVTLAEVLRARLAGIGEDTHRLLGAASVAGRRVDHDLLATIADLDERQFLSGLDEATTAGLLVAEVDGDAERYAFRHALMGEAVYDALLPGDRRRLHAAIATELESRPDPGDRAGRLAEIAHHWLAARDQERAIHASVVAGVAAFDAYAYAEAHRQFERALELWDAVADPEASCGMTRSDLLRHAGQAAQLAGAFTRAHDIYLSLLEEVDPEADPTGAGLIYERLGRALWTQGEIDKSIAAYTRAAELVPAEPPSEARARVLAGYAQILMLASRYTESLEHARDAIAMAQAVGNREIEAHAMASEGLALAQIGDSDAGIEILRRSVEISDALGAVDDLGRAYSCLSTAIELTGAFEEAATVSLEGAARMSEVGLGGPSQYGVFHTLNAASSYYLLGRWDEALRLAEGVSSVATGVGQIFCESTLAQLYVARGEMAAAEGALERGFAALGAGSEAQFNGPLRQGAIELHLWRNDLAEARQATEDALEVLAGTEDLPILSNTLSLGARVQAELAERARAGRDTAGADAAVARLADYRDELAAAMASFDLPAGPDLEARGHLALIEAEATRAGDASDAAAWRLAVSLLDEWRTPYPAAYARFRMAEALLAERSRRAEAVTELQAAHAAAVSLGARPLRERIEALAARARLPLAESASDEPATDETERSAADPLAAYDLTTREVEVLKLVAAGRTNRQIADELFISESTAGVHVSHIIGKLAVSGRVEAATIAARLGLVD
jgi:predicted ATPase/DNA-binding CsgD family transcriptional regulator